MSAPARRVWLFALSVVVSLGLCALLFRQIAAAEVGAVLARAEPTALALALGTALTVNLPLSALALGSALAAHGVKVPRFLAMKATLGHLALHAGASFVVGKGARALYLARVHGVDAKSALGAELTLLGLKVLALLTVAASGALLGGALWVLPCATLALLAAWVWMRRRGATVAALAASFGWALGMGVGQLAVFALALRALGLAIPAAALLAWFPLCLLGAKLPLAWLGLGLREALVVVLFRGSAPAEALLAASLVFSLLEQVLPGLLGLVFAPRFLARTLG